MSSPARVIGHLEVGRVLVRLMRGDREEIRATWGDFGLEFRRWRRDESGTWHRRQEGIEVRRDEIGALCTLAAEAQGLALAAGGGGP